MIYVKLRLSSKTQGIRTSFNAYIYVFQAKPMKYLVFHELHTASTQNHALRDLVLSHRLLDHAVHELHQLVDLLLRELARPAGGVLVGRRRQQP